MAAVARACRCLVRSRRWLVAVVLALVASAVPAAVAAGEPPPDESSQDDPSSSPEATCAVEIARDPGSEIPDGIGTDPLQCVLTICTQKEDWWLRDIAEGPDQWIDEWKRICTEARRQEGEPLGDDVVQLDSAWCEWLSILDVTGVGAAAGAPTGAGTLKEWCYRLQREAAYGVLQQGGAVSISCSYSTPLGASAAGVGRDETGDNEQDAETDQNAGNADAQDADLATHSAGYIQDLLKLLGWQPRMNVEIRPESPDWWAREILLGHECHLATRYPVECPSLEDQALGRKPIPITDSGDPYRYNPALDGRTPWQSTPLLPDPCVGEFPSNQYDIGYSTDGFVDIDDTVIGTLTNTFFSFGKGAMQVSFTFVNYAFEFDLVNGLGSVVDRAAAVYEERFVGDLKIADIAWLVLVSWVAILLVTRRFSLAAGEAIVAVLFLAIFTALMQNPRGHMEGAATTMKEVSASILEVDCDAPRNDPNNTGFDGAREEERVVDCAVSGLSRIQQKLHGFFVHEPYQKINWNADLDPDSPFQQRCRERMGQILSVGPHGNHDWPRTYMGRGGDDDRPCQRAALYNAVPTWDRLFMALLAGVMATIVAVILAAMGLTVLLAKFIVAMLFAVAPIALALAVLPSSGRRVATGWMTTLLQAIVVSIGMSIILALMMIALEEITAAVDGLDLVERWIVIIVVLMIVWYARKRFLTTMQSLASNIGDRLARPDLAGAGAGGFYGGGMGGRPPGGSMFGATRLSGPEAFGLATSALTTAATGGTLALASAKLMGKAMVAPARPVAGIMKARFAANRINRQNLAQLTISRRMDAFTNELKAAGGTAGGAAAGAAHEGVVFQKGRRTFMTRGGYKKALHKFGLFDEKTGELIERGYEHNIADGSSRRMWHRWWTGGGVRHWWQRNVSERARWNAAVDKYWSPKDQPRIALAKVRERRIANQWGLHMGPVEWGTPAPSRLLLSGSSGEVIEVNARPGPEASGPKPVSTPPAGSRPSERPAPKVSWPKPGTKVTDRRVAGHRSTLGESDRPPGGTSSSGSVPDRQVWPRPDLPEEQQGGGQPPARPSPSSSPQTSRRRFWDRFRRNH